MRRVKTIVREIDALECETEEELAAFEKLSDELYEVDPWNDRFHLGCSSWPNCDEGGCSE